MLFLAPLGGGNTAVVKLLALLLNFETVNGV